MARSVAHRFATLDSRLLIELYERHPILDTLEKIDPAALANISTWLVPRREAQALLDQSRAVLEPIVALLPKAIVLHHVFPSAEVHLRFRGLSFATWSAGRVRFGIGERVQELNPQSFPKLKSLLHDLEIHRHPLSSDTRHMSYRAQAERWLESIVREDVTRIDATLDPRFVYAQVLANAGGEHGILDLLGVTRSGRLAIFELKVSEYLHLPLQAADYWLRICRHLRQEDFSRYGYFPGITLQPTPPIIYLVAPALRFHPTFDVLHPFLDKKLELIRVGLAESWRSGLRVVMRQ